MNVFESRVESLMPSPDWNAATHLAETIVAPWRSLPPGAVPLESGLAADELLPLAGPGGVIAVFDTAGLRGATSAGMADIALQQPFTAATPSRYASISKHFLTISLLLAGVDLEAPLGSLLSDLPEAVAAVPLARALDMTGGLPDMAELLWQQGVPATASLSSDEIFAVARQIPGLCAAPGTEMAYSNTGWRLGQRILEAKRGRSYAEVLRRTLFERFTLPMAFPGDEAEIIPGLATGYQRNPGSAPAPWRRGRYGLNFSASGGIVGSAAALASWLGALMAGRGPLRGMLEAVAAPRAFQNGTPSVYRLGLVEIMLGGVRLLGHGGSLPGYRNHFWMAPELGCGVILLANHEPEPLWPALRVMAALIGQSLPAPAETLPASGLFATETGPFWAELIPAGADALTQPASLNFMGAQEPLVEAGEGAVRTAVRTLPAYLEAHLALQHDGALAGSVGGVARRLLPVPVETALDPRLVGLWRGEATGQELLIRADATARFPWGGMLGLESPLRPLPGARALAALPHAGGVQRPCLYLREDGCLVMASHRSRVLTFRRV